MTTGNARVDELMEAITCPQGDGATSPFSTDPSGPGGSNKGEGIAADAGANHRGALVEPYGDEENAEEAAARWRAQEQQQGGEAPDAMAPPPVFAPRADLEDRKPLGVTLSDAIITMNVAGLSIDTITSRLPRPGQLADVLAPFFPDGGELIVFRASDVAELRRLLVAAKAQAEDDAQQLKTARRNCRLAMAEASRLDRLLTARVVDSHESHQRLREREIEALSADYRPEA